MPVYSADQIVGKTLIAKKNVPLTRQPVEGAPVVYTAKKGESIGKVYSWIGGNGSPLWWQFLDQNGKPYYVKHQIGLFDIQALSDQGALNVKEATEAQNTNPGPLQSFLSNVPGLNFDIKPLTNLIIAGGVVYAGVKIIQAIEREQKKRTR